MSLEETAAAPDQITATVKISAEGASHARQIAVVADDGTKTGTVVMHEASNAVEAIAASAQQMSRILPPLSTVPATPHVLMLSCSQG